MTTDPKKEQACEVPQQITEALEVWRRHAEDGEEWAAIRKLHAEWPAGHSEASALPSVCIQTWWQSGYDAGVEDNVRGHPGLQRGPWCGPNGHSIYCPLARRAAPTGRPPCDALALASPSASQRLDVSLSAWPIADVLERLADATDHLRGAHACDVHGHEGFLYAAQAARAHAKLLRAEPTGQPQEAGARDTCVDCQHPASAHSNRYESEQLGEFKFACSVRDCECDGLAFWAAAAPPSAPQEGLFGEGARAMQKMAIERVRHIAHVWNLHPGAEEDLADALNDLSLPERPAAPPPVSVDAAPAVVLKEGTAPACPRCLGSGLDVWPTRDAVCGECGGSGAALIEKEKK